MKFGLIDRPLIREAGVVLLTVGVMTLVRLALDPVLSIYAPYIVFTIAVIISAAYGGFRAGLAATAMGVAIGNYLFLAPKHAFVFADPQVWLQSLTFVTVSLVITWLSAARRQSNLRAERLVGQLRQLMDELTRTEQEERRKLAAVLHDELQQLLVATRLRLGQLGQRLDPSASEARQAVQEADELVDASIRCTRTLTFSLAPPLDRGLSEPLRRLVEQARQLWDMDVRLRIAPEVEDLPINELACAVLVEAARELLFNVAKHAQTKCARVAVRQRGQNLILRVRDRGVGMNPAEAAAMTTAGGDGFGLFNVQQRLCMVGGNIVVASHDGHGTTVTVSMPVAKAVSAEVNQNASSVDQVAAELNHPLQPVSIPR